MKEDKHRHDADEIHNLDDLIKARSEKLSHMAADVDAFGDDIDIPDSLDASEALTFPHPKHAHARPLEAEAGEAEEDWENAQDIQPSDYEHGYNEATDAHATDDPDRVADEVIHEIGHMDVDQVSTTPTEVMPQHFTPDEESTA